MLNTPNITRIASSIALKNDLDMNFFDDVSYRSTGGENYKAVSMDHYVKLNQESNYQMKQKYTYF
jgi:hypothetical protein